MADETDTRASGTDSGVDLVRTAARAYERDRYLAALLAPREVRTGLMALAAFAGEIARIPSFVDEPMMGLVRLQWWRDCLARPAQDHIGHPIADALRDAMTRHRLPSEDFEALIDAHSDQLEEKAILDEATLDGFVARTETIQFRLAWRTLHSQHGNEPPALIAAAGEAYGRARLLLELPAQIAEGRLLLPASRLSAAGVTPEHLRLGTAGAAGRALVLDFAADVRRRLSVMRPEFGRAPRQLRTALLPSALIEPYLKALERSGEDPRAIGDVAPLTRVWRLWIAHRLGRI